MGEKASQLTLLCLALDGFTFRYAVDLVVNSTVSSQIFYVCHNPIVLKLCVVLILQRRRTKVNQGLLTGARR